MSRDMVTSTIARLPIRRSNVGGINSHHIPIFRPVDARSDDQVALAGHGLATSVDNDELGAEPRRVTIWPEQLDPVTRVVDGPCQPRIFG